MITLKQCDTHSHFCLLDLNYWLDYWKHCITYKPIIAVDLLPKLKKTHNHTYFYG